MRIASVLLFSTLCPAAAGFSQTSSVNASVTSTDTSRIDTNYVYFYKDKLVLALWQSNRKFDILLDQKYISDTSLHSAVNYVANSNHVSGVSLDFDIIGFAFGFRSVPSGNKRTGSTDYLDLGLNISTRRFRFENSWKRYTGFHDLNTPDYVQPFNDTVPYTQFPSMNLRVIKSKMIYTFSKKKFALSAAYANVKRQVKSRGSWVMVANFYGLGLHSDSSIIPVAQQKHYGAVWDGLNGMNIYAFSAGFGGTYSLVFLKRFYFNVFASLGFERQYRHFYIHPENTHFRYWKTWFASDYRVAVGYNAKRFFMRLSGIYDINTYESKDLKFNLTFWAGSFDFGYRFNFIPPKPYRKFQETKIYKML